MIPVRLAAAACAFALVVSACGGDDPEPDPTPTPDFEVPSGVELTPSGTELEVGDTATFAYELGDGAGSAVTATIESIDEGAIDEDFTFFTLDDESKASTPYYVTASLINEGPAGLGGVAPPFVLRDDQNSIAPPNTLNGTFTPCEPRAMPDSLLPGEDLTLCMVFLVPEGRSLVSIDARTADPGDTISWTP